MKGQQRSLLFQFEFFHLTSSVLALSILEFIQIRKAHLDLCLLSTLFSLPQGGLSHTGVQVVY